MILLAFRLAITLVAVDRTCWENYWWQLFWKIKNYIAREDPEGFFIQTFYMPSRNVISAVMSHFARCWWRVLIKRDWPFVESKNYVHLGWKLYILILKSESEKSRLSFKTSIFSDNFIWWTVYELVLKSTYLPSKCHTEYRGKIYCKDMILCISCMFNEDATGIHFQILCMYICSLMLNYYLYPAVSKYRLKSQDSTFIWKMKLKVMVLCFRSCSDYYHTIPRTSFTNATMPY